MKGKSKIRRKKKWSRLGEPVSGRGPKSRRGDDDMEAGGEIGKPPKKRSKKFEYELMDDTWGQEKTTLEETKTIKSEGTESKEEHEDDRTNKDHSDHTKDGQEPRVEGLVSQEPNILRPSLQVRVPPTITGKYGGTVLIVRGKWLSL